MSKIEKMSVSAEWLWKILPIGVSVVGMGFLLLGTRLYGIGITPDSVGYISTAQNLRQGLGFTDWEGSPLILQPPLYSILIAITNLLFSISFSGAARVLSVIGLGTTLFIASTWCIRYIKSRFLCITAIASLLVAIPYSQVFIYAWSEVLFIPLTLLAIFLFIDYSLKGSLRVLIVAAIVTGLCALTRYPGVILALVALPIIFFQHYQSFRQKLIRLVLFWGISLVPLGLWFLRNYIVSHTLTGLHGPATVTLFETVDAGLSSIKDWFVPYFMPEIVKGLAIVGGIVLAVAAIFLRIKKKQDDKPLSGNYLSDLAILFGFVVAYCLFMCISTATIKVDDIGTRFLSPIYAPLILCIVVFFDRFSLKRMSIITVALPLWFSIGLIALSTARDLKHYSSDGAGWWGYSTSKWRTSPTLHYLKNISPSDQVYSNSSDVIYYLAGIPARTLPEQLSALSHLQSVFQAGPRVYFVWFNTSYDPNYDYAGTNLLSLIGGKAIFTGVDGSVYLLEKK